MDDPKTPNAVSSSPPENRNGFVEQKTGGSATTLVDGDRLEQHGDVHECFARIAALWTAYLKIRREPAAPLCAFDAAEMMSLMKKARKHGGAANPDDHVDDVGYAAIAGELAPLSFFWVP
ncbi:DUF6378 domain-containing protein [Chelatococcus sp. GCM10030263]|uniref:DUF6378 domain-containing protein n=1 Tax=Chelatococcus sp. GCM10030263 TaxID=3273387 RepID=UPI00361FC41D